MYASTAHQDQQETCFRTGLRIAGGFVAGVVLGGLGLTAIALI